MVNRVEVELGDVLVVIFVSLNRLPLFRLGRSFKGSISKQGGVVTRSSAKLAMV